VVNHINLAKTQNWPNKYQILQIIDSTIPSLFNVCIKIHVFHWSLWPNKTKHHVRIIVGI